jgi:transposase
MPPRRTQAKTPTRPSRKPFYCFPHGHSEEKRRKFVQLMSDGVPPDVAAVQLNISYTTAKRWLPNLRRYNSIHCPFGMAMGRPRKLSLDDEKALFEALLDCQWMYQDEMVFWLAEERGVEVS